MYYPWKKEEKKTSPLKGILIAVGVIVSVMAVMAIVYKLFKKYFKITFECGDCDPCDTCECGVCDELEPECCFVDDEDDVIAVDVESAAE